MKHHEHKVYALTEMDIFYALQAWREALDKEGQTNDERLAITGSLERAEGERHDMYHHRIAQGLLTVWIKES